MEHPLQALRGRRQAPEERITEDLQILTTEDLQTDTTEVPEETDMGVPKETHTETPEERIPENQSETVTEVLLRIITGAPEEMAAESHPEPLLLEQRIRDM